MFTRHDLSVVFDEVFGLTTLDDSVKFRSILSIKDIPNPEKTYMIWSFSKVSIYNHCSISNLMSVLVDRLFRVDLYQCFYVPFVTLVIPVPVLLVVNKV